MTTILKVAGAFNAGFVAEWEGAVTDEMLRTWGG